MSEKYRFPVILAAAALAFHLFAGLSFIRSTSWPGPLCSRGSSGCSLPAWGRYRPAPR